jgi:hypothetical protein
MRDRRAQVTDWMFWIFYITMTSAVVYFVAVTPASVFSQKTDTASMENAIFAERVHAKLGYQSPLTKRVYPGVLPTMAAWDPRALVASFNTAGTPRQLAVKVSLDQDEAYFNEELYRRSKPLTPVRYQNFIETRPVWIVDQQKLVSLTIDQVYAPQPPRGAG